MAKKGQTVQLQVEVNTDEEWEKLLMREGLIIVDVFSEWCGPCLAMQAMLKKLKLEVGGDFLHLAMAKADTVTCLKRFLDKSEPTWMFIAQKQMVHILFGANAPVLQQAVLDELKKEKDCAAGARSRSGRAPNELSEEERGRFSEIENKRRNADKIKKDKIEKQIRDRKMAQAKNILDTMAHNGIIIMFPHCANKMSEFTENYIPNSGLLVSKKERPVLTAEALDDIEYFSPYKIPENSRNNLTSGEKSYALMVTQGEDSHGPLDDKVLSFVYGHSKHPPGDKDSPADHYMKRKIVEKPLVVEGTESIKSHISGHPEEAGAASVAAMLESEPAPEPEPEGEEETYGIWAPANDLVKAAALRYVFPLITAPLIIPEPEPIPPHVAVAFDAFKRDEVLKLSEEFANDVMAYGFFTSQVPEEAKLIAKTKQAFLRKSQDTKLGEKIVVKLSRKKSDAVLAFAQLGPTYISGNVDEGEKECAIFFPDGYAEIEDEVVEEEVPLKKKDRRKGKQQPDTTPKTSDETTGTVSEVIVFEEGVVGEGGEAIAMLQEADKATTTGEPEEAAAEVAPSKAGFGEAAASDGVSAAVTLAAEGSGTEAPAAEASAEVPAAEAPAADAVAAEAPAGEAPPAEAPLAVASSGEAATIEASSMAAPAAEASVTEAPPVEESPAAAAPAESASEGAAADAPAATDDSPPPAEG